jgi:hypothetical protein
MNNINDDELNKPIEGSLAILCRNINEIIKQNKDGKQKFVGDIVLVWDMSRLTEFDTGEVNTDIMDHNLITRFPSIVIEDSLTFNADIVLDDRVYPCNLDIVIWNKTLGRKYRTSSNFVKISEKGL